MTTTDVFSTTSVAIWRFYTHKTASEGATWTVSQLTPQPLRLGVKRAMPGPWVAGGCWFQSWDTTRTKWDDPHWSSMPFNSYWIEHEYLKDLYFPFLDWFQFVSSSTGEEINRWCQGRAPAKDLGWTFRRLWSAFGQSVLRWFLLDPPKMSRERLAMA